MKRLILTTLTFGLLSLFAHTGSAQEKAAASNEHSLETLEGAGGSSAKQAGGHAFTKADMWALNYGLYVHFSAKTFSNGPIQPEQFAPTALDVKSWAHAAKDAGTTFAVLMVKHADGFCLWDSKDYDYDTGGSPLKGDLIADFIAACTAEGIVPGVSYMITDVRQEGSYRNKEPVLPTHWAVIKKQITELHTRYPGLCVQIFEHSSRLTDPQWEELNETVRQLNSQCLILDAFREPRYSPAAIVKGNGWFWSPKAVITPESQLIQSWQQCQAEKKALIVSVGPDTSGQIPESQLAVLAEMKTRIQKQ